MCVRSGDIGDLPRFSLRYMIVNMSVIGSSTNHNDVIGLNAALSP